MDHFRTQHHLLLLNNPQFERELSRSASNYRPIGHVTHESGAMLFHIHNRPLRARTMRSTDAALFG